MNPVASPTKNLPPRFPPNSTPRFPPQSQSPATSHPLLPSHPPSPCSSSISIVSTPRTMDITGLAKKLGLHSKPFVVRKAEELRRQSDVQFNSSVMGIGEICKSVICLEIAATRFQVLFDRQMAVRLSGMSEKAYIRSFNGIQNSLGVKARLDVRELAIQFGCVRLIPFVQKGLTQYKGRFLEALPPSRRASTDFNRPVFTAVAFYLCAKRHKLKVDKLKLTELCGTSESEFASVSTSMKDLCFDVFGISKEKKDSREVKGHRELLDVLPGKRRLEDDADISDSSVDSEIEIPTHKRRKKMEKAEYDDWKCNVLTSNKQSNIKASGSRARQTRLSFTTTRKPPTTISMEAS